MKDTPPKTWFEAPPSFSEGRACLEEGCLGLQAFSQTFLELQFSLGNEGNDGKNLNSQTWPGTPRRPSSRHPRPPDIWYVLHAPMCRFSSSSREI